MGSTAEERISEIEERLEEITQNVTQRDMEMQSIKERLRDMEDRE